MARLACTPARGDYQLIVENLSDGGAGAQQRAFEELKAKLDTKGWFEPSTKQTLPKTPKHIAVITSPSGAVWHDIQTTAQRRYPLLTLSLLPVSVQGDEAPAAIVKAFTDIERYQTSDKLPLDAVIVARGGGSLEDLQAFNDEAVATAIHHCTVPVVSGVGHETDFSIADFVADQRAATPTAATELLTPNIDDYYQNLAKLQARQQYAWQRNHRNYTQQLDSLSSRIRHPREKIHSQQALLAQLGQRLKQVQQRQTLGQTNTLLQLQQRLNRSSPTPKIEVKTEYIQLLSKQLLQNFGKSVDVKNSRFKTQVAKLNIASPLATLARGYSLVNDENGALVSKAEQLQDEQTIKVLFADGSVSAKVSQ